MLTEELIAETSQSSVELLIGPQARLVSCMKLAFCIYTKSANFFYYHLHIDLFFFGGGVFRTFSLILGRSLWVGKHIHSSMCILTASNRAGEVIIGVIVLMPSCPVL